MRAAQISSIGNAQLVEVDIPQPGPHDVLIAVHAAGICGTDLHIYHGDYEATYPIIPGHEFSGIVAAVGTAVKRYHPGERVTADPNIPCNRCSACQRNQPNQCEALAAVGVTRAGAFAEFVLVPETNVFSIGSLTFEQAALAEPLACVVWGLKQVQIQAADSVLIFGAGPMGCLMLQAVRRAGAASVVISDVNTARLELAATLGATQIVRADDRQSFRLHELNPQGYDVVADVTGLPAVVEQAFEYVRPRGKVWIFGVCPPHAKACFIPYDVFRKDLTIVGSFAVNRTFQESIALLECGAVKVEPLISHRLPLEEFRRGLELAETAPERMKVQFFMNQDGS